ncbi:MAG: hypothetical protein VW270_06455 [Candidatus Poseidoniales archaeon]
MPEAKVQNAPHLVREEHTRAILNTDNGSLVAYKAARMKRQSIDDAIADINNVKEELIEIKLMIAQLVENRS